MKYNDPHEFLTALDEQLRNRAERIGRIQDYQNLKEELAIERFLARMDQNCRLKIDQLTKVMAERALHRHVVDKLSKGIPDPPDHWNDRFEELIEQTQSEMTMPQALNLIRTCVNKVIEST